MPSVRRAALARGGFLLVAAGAPAMLRAEPAAAQVRVATINTTDSSATPVYAEETGAFKREGLDVTITPLTTGGATIAAIAGGSIDIGFSNPLTAALAFQKGVPLTVLVPAMYYTPKATPSFMCRVRGGSVRNGADLVGKTVGVQSLNGELHLHAEYWVDQHGGDSKTVKWIEFTPGQMVAALREGAIAAATIGEPDYTAHKAEVEAIGDAYGGLMPKGTGIGGVYLAARAWVSGNPDAARRFIRAMVATARWANAHHMETGKILAARAKIDPEIVAAMTRIVYADALDPALVQPLFDVALKYGFLKQPASAVEMFADAAPLWRELKL